MFMLGLDTGLTCMGTCLIRLKTDVSYAIEKINIIKFSEGRTKAVSGEQFLALDDIYSRVLAQKPKLELIAKDAVKRAKESCDNLLVGIEAPFALARNLRSYGQQIMLSSMLYCTLKTVLGKNSIIYWIPNTTAKGIVLGKNTGDKIEILNEITNRNPELFSYFEAEGIHNKEVMISCAEASMIAFAAYRLWQKNLHKIS
jgi:hypothetical protein